ncbi:hypothetical protein NOR53_549 [gamma proteobacterium NOR5-3]|nr:hypothetical protein NOR53_549 [gamma proteobacterium NOR5-3]
MGFARTIQGGSCEGPPFLFIARRRGRRQSFELLERAV